MSDLNVAIRIGATAQGSVPRTVGSTVRQLQKIKRAESDLAVIQAKRAARQSRLIGATALGVAVLGPIAGATRAAIRFESTMADVRKVVDFDTPEQFAAMSADILKLSERIPVAASGLGDIAAEGGKLGLARGELAAFSEDVAKISVAWDLAPDVVANAMGKMRTIFGGGREATNLLAGTINHLSNNMAATAPEILSFVNRVGPMAKTMSFTARETAAFGSTFVALGIEPERAATSMTLALTRLGNAAHVESKQFRDVLDEMGIDAEELSERLREGGPEAFLDFLREVQESGGDGAIARLFGQEHVAQMTSLISGLPQLQRAVRLAADDTAAANSVQQEYAERAKTTANNLQLLKNRANVLGVNIGNVLLPAVNDAVGAIGGLVSKAAALAREFPGATKVVIGLVGGVTALAVGGAFAGYAATFLAEGWVRARIAMYRAALGAAWLGRGLWGLALRPIPTAIGALRLLKLALIGTGIGAAVVAIGVGAALIMRYWEPIGAFFSGFAEGVSEAFAPLAPVFEWLGETFAWLSEPLGYATEELEGFKSAGRSVGKIVGAAFNALTWPIRKVIQGVGGLMRLFGRVDSSEIEAAIKAMDEEPAGPRQSPVGQTFRAAAVGGALAVTAPAPPPEAMPAYPTAPVAAVAAPTGAPRAVPEVRPDALRAQVERDFAAVGGALGGDEEEDAAAQRRIEDGLAALAARGEAEAIAGERPGFGADRAGPPEVHQVFHNTFYFYGSGEEQFDELERRVVEIMRRAGGGTDREEDDEGGLS